MKKLNIMEFWFMNWLMIDKEINMDWYSSLSQEELDTLWSEFIEMYRNIK